MRAGLLDEFEAWKARNPLRIWRETERLSMRKAATILGFSVNTVQDWEHGSYSPRPANVRAVTEVTGITIAQWEEWELARPKA